MIVLSNCVLIHLHAILLAPEVHPAPFSHAKLFSTLPPSILTLPTFRKYMPPPFVLEKQFRMIMSLNVYWMSGYSFLNVDDNDSDMAPLSHPYSPVNDVLAITT